MLKFFLKKSEEDRAVERLVKESRIDADFILNLVISSIIITIGLVIGQISVVIGGMLIAPLLFPILSLGLSLATFSLRGIKRSIVGILISTIVGVSSSYIITIFLEGAEFRGQEFFISLEPSFLSFVVAFLSGISAVSAWIKRKSLVILPGVAIVVALVPPLCASGVALAVQDKFLFQNFLRVYFINLVGIVLASFLVFIFTDVSKIRKIEDALLEKEDKIK